MVILLGDEGKVKRCNTTRQHFLCLSLTPFLYDIRLWPFVLLLLLSFILPSFVGFCCFCYLFDYWLRYWGILLHSTVLSQVNFTLRIVFVQSLSLCPTVCRLMDSSMPGSPVPHHLPEFSQIHVHWVSDAIWPSHLLLPASPLPSVSLRIKVFSSELGLHIRWPKHWSFSFGLSPSNEYSVLISFRTDWFDLDVQGTVNSLLQHHSWKASVLWCSDFFMVQLSHLCMTTEKNNSLDYTDLCQQRDISAF